MKIGKSSLGGVQFGAKIQFGAKNRTHALRSLGRRLVHNVKVNPRHRVASGRPDDTLHQKDALSYDSRFYRQIGGWTSTRQRIKLFGAVRENLLAQVVGEF